MQSFESLVASLASRAGEARTLGEFSPPPRFGDKVFANYLPRHPSQAFAAERLRRAADALASRPDAARGWRSLLTPRREPEPSGIYLDGGFGVGKTHLLAAFWYAAPGPKAYLSFDELMYFVGLTGINGAAGEFRGYRMIAVDEWELDDPGNLKMALAFLREVFQQQAFVAVTSNTLPLELGAGRFSQKDFRSEVEELASEFEVLTIQGEDYRHRRFEDDPGKRYFMDPERFEALVRSAPPRSARCEFGRLMGSLTALHPIRYREIARAFDALFVDGMTAIPALPDALRWVHFVDSVYDAGTALFVTGEVPLGGIFDEGAIRGPYGKKLSRCLSRMEELLG